MYPYLINIWQFQVSTFGLSVTIWFFMAIWMLFRMSKRLDYSLDIFKNNILWYFLSVFFFSRLFYVISKWHDFKYIQEPIYFFIANEYNFSLIWGIFWFFIVFFILLKLRKESLDNYIYPVVLSFLFALPVWYLWALLWGQVYGKDTNFWIEFSYTNPETIVPYTSALFPLPIFYFVIFLLVFWGIYVANIYLKEKNILGYTWVLIFSCIIFIMEFFSWKSDIFKDFMHLNLNQISVIFLFWFAFNRVYKFYKKETRRWRS